MTAQNLTPVNQKERIQFIDAVRGIALLGILLMNSMAQSQPHEYYAAMNLSQPITGLNFYAWAGETFLFEGTMRGLFSILFGAGTLLFLNRIIKQKSGLEPADLFYRRMLWLLVFGLINAFVFLWPGDILYPYALCGLLLFPFRNWSARNLLLAALFLIAFGTYRENSQLYDKKETISKGVVAEQLEAKKSTLTQEQKKDFEKYKAFKEDNTSEGIAKKANEELKKIQGKSYVSIFTFYRDVNMWIQSVFFYNSWWDMLFFFFIGMALFKSGFLLGNKPVLLYTTIAVIGIFVGLLLNYVMLKAAYQLRFDNLRLTQDQKFDFYQIRRVFQTMGYLSLLILLYKVIPFRKILNVFAPVGQMAFTNYLSQSIITSIIFYGFGLFGKLQRYEIYYVVISIWAFQIVFSHLWLRSFRFGPFEWLWRSLTYWHKQPMRKGFIAPIMEEKELQDQNRLPVVI